MTDIVERLQDRGVLCGEAALEIERLRHEKSLPCGHPKTSGDSYGGCDVCEAIAAYNSCSEACEKLEDENAALRAIVQGFTQYHRDGVGQLTHLLASAEAAAKETTT